jgi:hypothetical protein
MATTTNYGWVTPDDTALVKDGAAAIRTLGSSVDTTTKALNPETTLGDLAYRSSTANVKTRLGLGTAGQVLTVNSGASAPEWANASAGGMTLLSTTTLSGATVTISSIPSGYINLFAIITGVTNATGNGHFRVAPNAQTNKASYLLSQGNVWAATVPDYIYLSNVTYAMGSGNNENVFTLQINDYASSTKLKTFQNLFGYNDPGNTERAGAALGYFKSTTAITSLVFDNTGGNLSTGTVLLYGVK